MRSQFQISSLGVFCNNDSETCNYIIVVDLCGTNSLKTACRTLSSYTSASDLDEDDAVRMSDLVNAEHEADLDNAFKPKSEDGPSTGVVKKPISSVSTGHRQDREDGAAGDERSPSPMTQPCPICLKEFDARDNLALNAHIDFCLSRDVIKQASASAIADPGVSSPGTVKRHLARARKRLGEWLS